MTGPRVTAYINDLDRTLTHGRISTYTNHSCRCRPCKDAWAAYSRAKRARPPKSSDGAASPHDAVGA